MAEHPCPRIVTITGDGIYSHEVPRGEKQENGIEALAHTTIGGLFRGDEAIVGAWDFGINGTPVFISAKKVIWATDGIGKIFPSVIM